MLYAVVLEKLYSMQSKITNHLRLRRRGRTAHLGLGADYYDIDDPDDDFDLLDD